MTTQHVFFIRGLSTYGRDAAKWSIFDFGPIYRHVARALVERKIEFYPVLNMGAGSLPEIARRAELFLDQHPVWNDPTKSVHLLGHSAGGLVARLLLKSLKRKPISVLTVATPHRGSALAEIVRHIPEKNRGSDLILRTFGYNVRTRKHFFDELAPEGLAKIFGADLCGDLTPPPGIRAGSIICSAPRKEWCLPLKAFYQIKAIDSFNLPSDGVVERDSQPYGDIVAELPIDHFRQVGLFGGGERFEKLTDSIANYFKSR